MGYTAYSLKESATQNKGILNNMRPGAVRIALAGNPNVGKSTLFNRLTGKNQHTGNWPGKTVTNAVGFFRKNGREYALYDLPGTYSLMAHSAEEEVARDFLCFEGPDIVLVICDATCLERNLNLVLQAGEICNRVIVAVNLLDEAKKKGIIIDLKALEKRLGLPVFGICARSGEGVENLVQALEDWENLSYRPIRVTYKKELEEVAGEIETYLTALGFGAINTRWLAFKLIENDQSLLNSLNDHLKYDFSGDKNLQKALLKARKKLSYEGITPDKFKDWLVAGLVLTAEDICDDQVIRFTDPNYRKRDLRLDRFLTGKITGPLIMLALLGVIFWITITGANYPSDMLWRLFSFIEGKLIIFADYIKLPDMISDMLIRGVYRVLTWVVSVMLPPMAIFFPLFTLLEDVGYLPRIAFNLDHSFKKCAACGKQALTMSMGFGCNAVGVTGCRIIDSPRERLIAVLTNSFVPCNGRFPILTAMVGIFFAVGVGGVIGSFVSAVILTLVILLSVAATFVASKFLSATILKGKPSSFALELPPYRKPKIGSVIFRSIFDRTIFVLSRAVSVAAPAGLIIWLFANITVGGQTVLTYCSGFLDPLGRLMGLDGVILLGFILGFPANEIVIPIIVMAYLSKGTLSDYSSLEELKLLLISNGWDWTTAVSMVLFTLFHWPCSTTLLTVKKETGSWGWTALALIIPSVFGILVCVLWNLVCSVF